MGPKFTIDELKKGMFRFVITPMQARDRLLEIRGFIDVLLETKSDALRIRAYKNIVRKLFWGWGEPNLLVFWSKIANTADFVEQRKKINEERAANYKDPYP